LALIGGGIVAAMARGPWVGAAALVVVMILTGRKPFAALAKLAGLGVIALPLFMFTGVGQKAVELLPFVGAIDRDTVDYRTQLFNVSWDIFLRNPILGSPYYLSSMEQLRQGEGIIDMVTHI